MIESNKYVSITAKSRFVNISASKARRVINLIRGKSIEKALYILRWTSLSASEPLHKVIMSAIANAKNNASLDIETLFITNLYADEGPTAKRIRPRAQGRAFRIRKRTCHMTVIIEGNTGGSKNIPASPAYALRSNGNKVIIKNSVKRGAFK